MSYWDKQVEFSTLLGKTIVEINGKKDDDQMIFTLDNGDQYKLYHDQDCCESVSINDIIGDLTDLIGSPLTMAEESTNSEDSMGIEYLDSFTWTFYKLATIKGYVTIRWLGESNGYYSESVQFIKL